MTDAELSVYRKLAQLVMIRLLELTELPETVTAEQCARLMVEFAVLTRDMKPHQMAPKDVANLVKRMAEGKP